MTATLLNYQAWAISDPGRARGDRAPSGLDTVESREAATSFERSQKGAIWAIADGFGPDERALHASRLAARIAVDYYWNAAISDPAARLRTAVERANGMLRAGAEGDDQAGGATLVAAVLLGNSAHVASVGRCRAYILRGSGIEQITRDHTWVAGEIAAGRLSPDEAAGHPRRNVLTRALGVQSRVSVDIVNRELHPGEMLLLCSDGLTRHLGDEQIARLAGNPELEDPAATLVAAANEAGGIDSISAVAIRITGVEQDNESTGERLAVLQSAGRSLGASLNLDETINSAMQELLGLLGGEHAAVVLSDGRGEPRFDQARQFILTPGGRIRPLEGDLKISRSVVSRVIERGEPEIIGDALSDPQLGEVDSIIDLSLRSILCVPLAVRQRTIGALYLDSSVQRAAFNQADLDLMTSFASQAAAAIENARLHQETARQQAHQQSIIRSMSSALIAVDVAGAITTWNPAAEQLTGVSGEQAVGRTLPGILPDEFAAWLRALSVQAEAGDQTMMIGHDWSGALGGRERVFLTARVARLRTVPGDPAGEGFVFLVNDLTEVVQLEEARRSEARRRQQIRSLFGRYLAPRVVEYLLENPDDVQLGGARQEVTILFADLRGFTTLSEHREPEEIVTILNRYLALATREIFAEMGTLDKFLGDGAMAIFNAPLALPDHEGAAIRAGLRMQAQFARLIEEHEGIDPIGFGIGINSGPAIVGNIGTPELMNYTAIGDAVNVSARLQAEAGLGEVLISDSTYQRVRERFEVEELGPRQVKGRSQPVMVYRVLGAMSDEG